jgi:alkylated DNA nucleotide flippase Atl1
MDARVMAVVDFLNRVKIRATYGAVGHSVGVLARSVGGMLGERSPRASWVVRKDTGEPTGYSSNQKHPDLYRTSEIITEGSELTRRMRRGS